MKRTLGTQRGQVLLGLAGFALMLLVGGCASAGNSFTYDPAQGLELGKMNRAEYRQAIGEPTGVSTVTNGEGTFEQVTFVYSQANMSHAQARALVLEFRNDMLNSYMYVSSYDNDKTGVNVAAARTIKQGVTKKDEVLKLMGQPQGRAKVPTVHGDFKGYGRSSVVEMWKWAAQNKISTFGSHAVHTDSVCIGFDAQGVVAEVAIQAADDGGLHARPLPN